MCSMKLKHIVFLASAYWVQTTKRYKYIYIRKIETQTSYSFIYLCGDGGGGGLWRQGPPSCSRRKQIDLLTL